MAEAGRSLRLHQTKKENKMKANFQSKLVNVRIGALFPIIEKATDEYIRQLDRLMLDMADSVRRNKESKEHPYLFHADTDIVYNSQNEDIGINFSLFHGRRENFLMDAKFLLGADEDSILSDAAWTAERLVGRLHEEMPEINFAVVAVLVVRKSSDGLLSCLPLIPIHGSFNPLEEIK
jgi:hypothetical protein